MEYRAWFECIAGCNTKYPLTDVVYNCKKCGALLEVVHDIEALKKKSAAEWIELFDSRYKTGKWPYGSSVWGKKEWVCPEIENENIVSLYEGGTNLLWAERFGKKIGLDDLWIKQCGNSHTGSFKDLGMTVLVSMVNKMIRSGNDIMAVACASTGDTSAALAAYCATAGIQSIVFLPKGKVSLAQLIQPISNGALVVEVESDFDGCMEIVQKVCKKRNIYLANSMNSLRIEGQKTISIELTQQFYWEVPDFVIIPGGNLGNVSALGSGFKMMRELGIIDKFPTIVLAQAENANPLYLYYENGYKNFEPIQAKKTLASAIQIGNPVSYIKATRVLKEFNGIVEQASEEEIGNACALGDQSGMFTCPHTGVALAVLKKLASKGIIKRQDKTVLISTANGLKFTDFKVKYHADELPGITPEFRNVSITVPNDFNKVDYALMKEVERRAPL